MKKKRLIPVLLLRNGWLVQSKGFKQYLNLGNPFEAVKRLSEWASDELIYLDISQDDNYDMRREDLRDPNRRNIFDILDDVSKRTFMPIVIGGRIRTIKDIEKRLSHGADKVALNTKPLEDEKIITESAKEFGSQCIVISIDVKKEGGDYFVYKGGHVPTKINPVDWAKKVESLGAGEILLNSIDRDGTKSGFEIPLLDKVSKVVKIPVIALGGAGQWEHFAEAFEKTAVDAVAAANVFQHIDQSVYLAKKYLFDYNFNVRSPELMSIKPL